MRVLLIATNRDERFMSRMEVRPLPIGLAYVAAHLDSSRHELKVMDLMFATDYLGGAQAAVEEFQPDLIGLSIRNLDNQSYLDPRWALPDVKELVQRIRAISGSTIVCGGPAFTILPRECFQYLEPDLGIAGDAAETFGELADRIDSGRPYNDLPGLVYRNGPEIKVQEQMASSAFPKPPRLEELDIARYRQAGFGIGVLTKLRDFYYPTGGTQGSADTSAWRVVRPVEEVVQEIQEMQSRFGLRKIFFIDSAFNLPLPHAKSLCQCLIDAGVKFRWNTSLAAIPDACDTELVSLMRQAGCSLVLMSGIAGGVDSDGAEGGAAALREVCRLCEDGGLNYTISQYFGEPGDTRETVETKLAFLKEVSPAMANLRVGVRILPGTPLSQVAVSEGLIADESQLVQPTFYLAEPVRGWIVDGLKAEAAQHPRWNLM